MTQALNNPGHLTQRRNEWIARVDALVAQIVEWSQAEGWKTERHTKRLQEKLLGEYSASGAVISLPGGELQVNPIALHIVGANGRVDLEAFPTLSRVKLLGVVDGWKIMTDSNIPLRVAWNREAFVQLAHDLLS